MSKFFKLSLALVAAMCVCTSCGTLINYGPDIDVPGYTSVVDGKGKSDAELFTETKQWIGEYHRRSYVIIDSEEHGKYIIIKPTKIFTVDGYKQPFTLEYTLHFKFDGGKVIYSIGDIHGYKDAYVTLRVKDFKNLKYDIVEYYDRVGERYEQYITNFSTLTGKRVKYDEK